jgi:anti-anti-sigma factor
VADLPKLGPLNVEREAAAYRFTIANPAEMSLELPADYDEFLATRLSDVMQDQDAHFELDLRGLPAISSRQLGLMLALQKALRGRCERLTLCGVSEGVRRLLGMTRTDRFFIIES